MQEPSGLLAPFLRVFLLLFIGGVRRAAPQHPRGLAPQRPVAQSRVGGPTKTPRAATQPTPDPATNQIDLTLPLTK